MALTLREASILERTDAGVPYRTVAREFGLDTATIRKIAILFSPCADAPRLYRAAMARANEAFVAALQREGAL